MTGSAGGDDWLSIVVLWTTYNNTSTYICIVWTLADVIYPYDPKMQCTRPLLLFSKWIQPDFPKRSDKCYTDCFGHTSGIREYKPYHVQPRAITDTVAWWWYLLEEAIQSTGYISSFIMVNQEERVNTQVSV